MCGISGFVGDGEMSLLKKMTDKLSYRGPDDEGFWHDKKNAVYLGHRRLSILDIAGGSQPMTTDDQVLVIIFNGEIYNFSELRDHLKKLGYKFKTDRSDTEVLLMAYRAWGEKMTNKLNGMWSFVIYDTKANKLFCSRDRFGKKPFFYTIQNHTFVFASELSSLILHPKVKAKLSKRSLQKYFSYGYIPSPLTIYENIYKLPGGYSLTLDIATLSISIKKYWEFILEPFSKIPKNPETVWGEEIRDLLDKAVKRRLVSDVPVGVFLSGGIDSSAVVSSASKYLPPGVLKTFSIGFEESSFDESKYAEIISKFFKTNHKTEVFSFETARKILPDIIKKLDEPLGDSSLLPTYLVSKFTRKHVTVALGGDGGDELFAGYDPFRVIQMAKIYQKIIPKKAHTVIESLISALPVSHENMSLDFKLKRTLRGLSHSPVHWLPVWMSPLAHSDLEDLFNEPVDLDDVYSEAGEIWEQCPQDNLVDKVLQFYTKIYLQDDILVKVDRASMMNSLEVRAPFLDIDLVNLVRRIPWNFKIRHGITKYILKKALEDSLPREILYRPKKGFGIPIGKWFKDGLLKFDKQSMPYLDQEFINHKIADHQSGKSDERAFLWNLWVLSSIKSLNQKG